MPFNRWVSQEPFGDIPLFREIQKLLSSSTGPVNLEIARQVAVATATQGRPDPPIDADARRSFADAVRAGEQLLAGYLRLPFEEPARTELVTVRGWIDGTLAGWRWLLERVATRLGGELARAGGEAEGTNPMQAALAHIGPLLMGMQVGTLVGNLAGHALGRYDLPIPREDDSKLLLVDPNAQAVARDYGLDPARLRVWLALDEVAHHLVVDSVPWAARYLKSLLLEVVDAIEIDLSDLERRFVELQAGGMEALQEGASAESLLPVVPTERHRRALDRLRAFLALFEGYAAHGARAVASEVVEDHARVEEGMTRRRAATGEAESLLSSILGISVDRALETSGATFCAAIVKLKGQAALNRVWEAPDNLPTREEIRDPFAWIERHGL
jgi:putative hydrolase